MSVDPRMTTPVEPKAVCGLSTNDLADTVLTFVQELTGVRFYAYQYIFVRRIVQSILCNDGDTITGLWSRQSGKTEALADLGFGLCVILPVLAAAFSDDPRLASFRRGFRIGIFAPILEQATISFQRMRALSTREATLEVMQDSEINVYVEVNRGDTLTFTNGSMIQARSASPDSQIEGKTYELVMLEESQKLTQTKVDKEIRPMLAATNGSMVKIGTAWISRGGFHTSITQNIENWKLTGKRNHFEFPYDLVIAEKRAMFNKDADPFHLNYEKFVDKEIRRLGGVDSLEFKMNFRCLWNESRALAVNPEVLRNVQLTEVEVGIYRQGFQVAGLDIGKINDSTVLTVMEVDMENPVVNPLKVDGQDEDRQIYYRKRILDWLVLEGAFEGTTGQYETIVRYLAMTNVRVLCIDTTGVGDPFAERLEAMLGENMTIIPMTFSLPTKSKLYKYYLQELHAYRLFYPAGPVTRESIQFRRFIQENEQLDRVQHGIHVTYQHPGTDGHDDFPDSAALACWAEKLAPDAALPEMTVTYLDGEGRKRGGGDGNVVEVAGGFSGSSRASRYSRRGR
jgi:hypothetical protein